MTLYQLADALVDLLKPRSERISRFRANHPALDQPWRQRAIAFDKAVTRDGSSGIDPQNYHSMRLCNSRVALALCALVYVAVCGDFLHVIEILELLEELHERLGGRSAYAHEILRNRCDLGFGDLVTLAFEC